MHRTSRAKPVLETRIGSEGGTVSTPCCAALGWAWGVDSETWGSGQGLGCTS